MTKGKISLIEEGKDFCLKQVAAGLKAFASVLSGELHSFRELACNTEGDFAELEEEVDPDDELECEEDEADEEEDEGVDSTSADNELTEFSKIADELPVLPPLRSERVAGDICAWHFPKEISQSTFNGRNGSNACSLISILIAYLFGKKKCKFQTKDSFPIM